MPRELRDALCKRHPWGSVCEKTKEIRAEVGVKAGLRRWSESEKSAVLDYLAAHEPRMILNFENVRNKLCPLLPDRTINAVLAMTKQLAIELGIKSPTPLTPRTKIAATLPKSGNGNVAALDLNAIINAHIEQITGGLKEQAGDVSKLMAENKALKDQVEKLKAEGDHTTRLKTRISELAENNHRLGNQVRALKEANTKIMSELEETKELLRDLRHIREAVENTRFTRAQL